MLPDMIKPELIELVNELKPGEITTLDDALRLSIEKWIRIRDAWKDGREIRGEHYTCYIPTSRRWLPIWDNTCPLCSYFTKCTGCPLQRNNTPWNCCNEWKKISDVVWNINEIGNLINVITGPKQHLVPLVNKLTKRIALEYIKVKYQWEANPDFEKNEERLNLKNGYFFIVTYSGFVHLSNIYDNETLHGSIIEWKYSSKSTAKRGVARMILNSQKFLTNGKKVLDIMDGVLKQQKPFSLYSDSDRSTANKSKKRIYNAMQLLG